MDTQLEYEMVTEALAVHEANGTQGSLLAQRLREAQSHYLQTACGGFGVDDLVRLSEDDQPAKQQKGGMKPTGDAPKSGASDAQLGYARKLWSLRMSERLATTHHLLHAAGQRMMAGGPIDKRTCSQLIDALNDCPWRTATPTGRVPAREGLRDAMPEPAAPLEPGYYRKGEEFFRVKISRTSGRPYAELWIDGGWDYESARGVVRHLTSDMVLSAEDAKAFGDRYHACVYCTTQLTDQRSVNAGYGPKCAAKHGLPWG